MKSKKQEISESFSEVLQDIKSDKAIENSKPTENLFEEFENDISILSSEVNKVNQNKLKLKQAYSLLNEL